MSNMVSRTLSVHKEHELLLKLEIAGLNDELAQRIVGSRGNSLAKRIIRFIENGGFDLSTSQKLAREIMGKNFFGIKDAVNHFEIDPSETQTVILSEIPFTDDVLESCKDTHVLVAVFPMSILDIRGKVEHKLFSSHEDGWYNEESFAKDKGKTRWHLIRKTSVANLNLKTWDEQQVFLTKNEEIPSARVLVYTIIGHFLATRERLFEYVYGRTSSVDSKGHHVGVGYFENGLLHVRNGFDSTRDLIVGVSSARKS